MTQLYRQTLMSRLRHAACYLPLLFFSTSLIANKEDTFTTAPHKGNAFSQEFEGKSDKAKDEVNKNYALSQQDEQQPSEETSSGAMQLKREKQLNQPKIEHHSFRKGIFLTSSVIIIALLLALLKCLSKTKKLRQQLLLLDKQLKETGLIDPLTKLHNRRYFLSKINDFISHLIHSIKDKRAHPKNLGIIILDIDHFKPINDTHGHNIGDEILTQFAQRLRSLARENDLLARWGGEEFVMTLKDVDQTELAQFAKEILNTTANTPFKTSEPTLNVTCSIGAVLFPLFNQAPELLDWDRTLHIADQALYQAKDNGRNQAIIVHATSSDARCENPDMSLTQMIDSFLVTVNCMFSDRSE